MIELSQVEYDNVLPLLNNQVYEPVFAYSIIDHNQSGKVFVDQIENPACSLIINSYGQYLLAGSGENERFLNDVAEYLLNEKNHSNYYDLYAYSRADISNEWKVSGKDSNIAPIFFCIRSIQISISKNYS